MEIYAWVGEDELGSGEVGIKNVGINKVTHIEPLTLCIHRERMHQLLRPDIVAAMALQQRQYGKKIRLVRFIEAETIMEAPSGTT